MGIISRFLLLLYTLIVGATVVIIAGACLDIMPAKFWQPSLKFIMLQPETLVALAVMLVLSLFFLTRVFASSKDEQTVNEKEIVLQQGQVGEVRVAVDAVERIAERAALSVVGIREAQAVVVKSRQIEHCPRAGVFRAGRQRKCRQFHRYRDSRRLADSKRARRCQSHGYHQRRCRSQAARRLRR